MKAGTFMMSVKSEQFFDPLHPQNLSIDLLLKNKKNLPHESNHLLSLFSCLRKNYHETDQSSKYWSKTLLSHKVVDRSHIK